MSDRDKLLRTIEAHGRQAQRRQWLARRLQDAPTDWVEQAIKDTRRERAKLRLQRMQAYQALRRAAQDVTRLRDMARPMVEEWQREVKDVPNRAKPLAPTRFYVTRFLRSWFRDEGSARLLNNNQIAMAMLQLINEHPDYWLMPGVAPPTRQALAGWVKAAKKK